MLDLGDFVPHFTFGPGLKIGLAVLVFGFLLLFSVLRYMSGPKILIVPDGTPPDQFYREWKAQKWTRRVGRGWLFVTFMGIGMLLGGCGVILVNVR